MRTRCAQCLRPKTLTVDGSTPYRWDMKLHAGALALAIWLLPSLLRAEGPVAVPGTADVEDVEAPSSPLVVRGTADTLPLEIDRVLSSKVELRRTQYKRLLQRLQRTQWNRPRTRADIEELKEERKGLEALEREVETAEDKLNNFRRATAEEGRASHVSAPSAH
jgi:hypothetical protein